MRSIRVVRIGDAERHLLDAVRSGLARELRMPCSIDAAPLDPSFAHHPERNQFHSTRLIEQLDMPSVEGPMSRWASGLRRAASGKSCERAESPPPPRDEILVGVTDVDLYIPILSFVFGEAQLGGHIAVVSYHRLQQQFYGLPRDDSLLRERLVKEAIHEAGHTRGLTHCDDYDCVMASSHAVEWLDLKGAGFCSDCRRVLL